MKSAPKATVLLPVYNAAAYLREALDSVLSQDFADFELLAIDDGSSDESGKILAEYAARDPRVRVVTHAKNLRLIGTLNEGLEQARGEYVIRMDADDRCLPGRFARQVAFMDAHPQVAVSGGWAWVIGADGARTGQSLKTYAGRRLRYGYWRPSPVIHPSAIMRRSALKGRRFDPEFLHAEDYAFWLPFGREGALATLPDYLIEYRVHGGGVSVAHQEVQAESALRALRGFLGRDDISLEELDALEGETALSLAAYLRLQKKAAASLPYPADQRLLDAAIYAVRRLLRAASRKRG